MDSIQNWPSFAALRKGQLTAGVRSCPWPVIYDAATLTAIATAAEAVAAGLGELLARHAATGAHADRVVLPPGAAPFVALDHGRVDPVAIWRFDFVLHAGKPCFLECNAGDPSGLGIIGELVEAFSRFAPFQAVAEGLSTPDLLAAHRAVVARRCPGAKRVVFLGARESHVLADIRAMAANYRRAGWDAEVADPRDLAGGPEGLWLGDRRIDVVLRDTIDELAQDPFLEAGRRVAEAYKAGQVAVLNPFGSCVADAKSLLAVPADGAGPAWAQAVPHLPATYRPGEGAATRAGLGDRRRWVLKPSEGWGGHGVVVGRSTSPVAWATAVEAALAAPHAFIAQAHVPQPIGRFPVETPSGTWIRPRRYITSSAWAMDGRFVGCFARVGATPVINVKQGSALVPVYGYEGLVR